MWLEALTFGGAGLIMLLFSWKEMLRDVKEATTRALIPWKALVPAYTFFASLAVGSALILWLYSYTGVYLIYLAFVAIASLFAAWALVLIDLGRPDHAASLLLSPNPSSRIAWNPLLYGLFFLALLWAALQPGVLQAATAAAIGLILESNLAMAYGTTKVKGWEGVSKVAEFWLSAALLGLAALALYKPMPLATLALALTFLLYEAWEAYEAGLPGKVYAAFAVPLLLGALIPQAFPLIFLAIFVEKLVTAYYPQARRASERPYSLYFKREISFLTGKEAVAVLGAVLFMLGVYFVELSLYGI